jgi:urea transport system ATP-binding protein
LVHGRPAAGAAAQRPGQALAPIRRHAHVHRTTGLLSHGQPQRGEIGMLLAPDPMPLPPDEPLAGMTDEETGRTAELSLPLEGGHSLVVVEHGMAIVPVEPYRDFPAGLAERHAVMERGEVIAHGRAAAMATDGVRALRAI